MAFMDIVDSFMQKLRQGPFGVRENGQEPNLPNGGHTGYHPVMVDKKKSQTSAMQSLTASIRRKAMEQQAMETPQTGAWQQGTWGMNQQNTWQQAGQQTAGNGWQQPAPNAWQQPQQTGYQSQWQPAQQTGYQSKWQQPQQPTGYQSKWQPQQTGYQPQWQQLQQTGGQPDPYGWQQAQAQSEKPHFGEMQRQGNVSYMPGNFVGEDGVAYRHVERLAQPLSAATCYRLIEFMRNEETVIVNTELIHDERENQRCLDLLFGAAFTMNCTFTRISARSIYLIAPKTVSVIPYESIRQMNEQDQMQRWPGVHEDGTYQREEAQARRGQGFRVREWERDGLAQAQ